MSADFLEVFDLWKRQSALLNGYAAMAPFAGFVMANRLARMTVESGRPTPAGLREVERMVSEKVSAAMESGLAATRVLGRLARTEGPVAAVAVMVAAGEAALKPVSRTVRANARRLSRAS